MKKTIIAILVCMISLSCSKNNDAVDKAITGSWEIRKATGGIMALIEYAPGNGNTLVFKNDKKFQRLNAGSVFYEGSFDVAESPRAGDYILTMQYQLNGMNQTIRDSIRFDKNQLIILPFATCCDIQTVFYERLLK